MSSNEKPAPERWLTWTMSQLGEWTGGSTPKKDNPAYWQDGTMPWVSPKDMKLDHIGATIDYITEAAIEETSAKIVPASSLLFVTRSGILRHTLPVSSNTVPVVVNQDIKALTFHRGLEPEFFRYQVMARAADLLKATVKTGVTVESVDFTALKQFSMLVPSAEEQRDITAELDKLTYLLESALESLTKSRELLASLLAATLKEAFDGAEMSEGSWPTIELGQLVSKVVAGKSMRCRERPPRESEKGVIKVSAVTWGAFKPLESKTLPDNYTPNPSALIRRGDLLISRANTRELVGACVIVEDAPANLYLSDKVLRLQLNDTTLTSWVHWFLRSSQGREQLESMAHGTQASMLNIPQKALLRCVVPMPDEEARKRAIDNVRLAQEYSAASLADVETAEKKVRELRQAVLDLAFTGALSPKTDYPPAGDNVTNTHVRSELSKSKNRRKASSDGATDSDLASILSAVIAAFGSKGATFEEVRNAAPAAAYEELQEAIFDLLGAKSPRVTQVFDKASGRLLLVSTNK